jgi:hypothetical protein
LAVLAVGRAAGAGAGEEGLEVLSVVGAAWGRESKEYRETARNRRKGERRIQVSSLSFFRLSVWPGREGLPAAAGASEDIVTEIGYSKDIIADIVSEELSQRSEQPTTCSEKISEAGGPTFSGFSSMTWFFSLDF